MKLLCFRKGTAKGCAAPGCTCLHRYDDGYCNLHRNLAFAHAPAPVPEPSATRSPLAPPYPSHSPPANPAANRQVTVRGAALRGFRNLGNTCYMASALQCLSHIQVLSEFFLDGYYEVELNADNFLGTGGKLARAYSKLLEEMHAPNAQAGAKGGYGASHASAVSPTDFKRQLSKFAPQFDGYDQHDSQVGSRC